MIEDMLNHVGSVMTQTASQDQAGGVRLAYTTIVFANVAARIEDMNADEIVAWAQKGVQATHRIFMLPPGDLVKGYAFKWGTRTFYIQFWQYRRAIGSMPDMLVVTAQEIAMSAMTEP